MANLTLTHLFPMTFFNENTIPKTLGDEFALCDNGNVVFHWADFHETCDTIKEQLSADPELKEDFQRREAALLRLGLIPVWIRTRNKVHQLTMHDLYERHVLNQNDLVELDPFGPLEISFISGTGPFKTMAIAECFNQSTYRDFVLVSLLKGKLPKRSFRIRMKAKILVEFGEDFSRARLVNLEQLTSNGLLLSVESEFYTRELSQSKSMRMLIETNILHEAMGKTLPELKAHLGSHAFNLMYSSRKEDAVSCELSSFCSQSSFDFFRSKKVYLFISYDNFSQSGAESARRLKSFVDYSRELVKEYYKGSAGKLKSA